LSKKQFRSQSDSDFYETRLREGLPDNPGGLWPAPGGSGAAPPGDRQPTVAHRSRKTSAELAAGQRTRRSCRRSASTGVSAGVNRKPAGSHIPRVCRPRSSITPPSRLREGRSPATTCARNLSMRRILSVRELAAELGVPVTRLREIAQSAESYYKPQIHRDKKNPAVGRHLWVPHGALKEIQRRLHRGVLSRLDLHPGVHGGVRGRSPKKNAGEHLAPELLVKVDVRKCFDKIRHHAVYAALCERGWGREVAHLVTRLVTRQGEVPQGAPTSTSVANLVLDLPVDRGLMQEMQSNNVRYTRWVDDIALSGGNARQLINPVAKALSKRRLRIHRKSKLVIASRAKPQVVTGLTVNSGKPSVPRADRDRVRTAIFQLRHVDDASAFDAALRSIRGRIKHVEHHNPGAGHALAQRLEATLAQLSRQSPRQSA
jgi:RNA-directed DNA polymerase